MQDPKADWTARAAKAAAVYGLNRKDVEDAVRRQLGEKVAEKIVQEAMTAKGGLVW